MNKIYYGLAHIAVRRAAGEAGFISLYLASQQKSLVRCFGAGWRAVTRLRDQQICIREDEKLPRRKFEIELQRVEHLQIDGGLDEPSQAIAFYDDKLIILDFAS